MRADRIAHALDLRRRYHVAAVRDPGSTSAAYRSALRAWRAYRDTMLSPEERGWVLAQWARHVCPGSTCPLAARAVAS